MMIGIPAPIYGAGIPKEVGNKHKNQLTNADWRDIK